MAPSVCSRTTKKNGDRCTSRDTRISDKCSKPRRRRVASVASRLDCSACYDSRGRASDARTGGIAAYDFGLAQSVQRQWHQSFFGADGCKIPTRSRMRSRCRSSRNTAELPRRVHRRIGRSRGRQCWLRHLSHLLRRGTQPQNQARARLRQWFAAPWAPAFFSGSVSGSTPSARSRRHEYQRWSRSTHLGALIDMMRKEHFDIGLPST